MAETRVALITGGARGLGRGIGLSLAGDGWNVAYCYRTSAEDAESAKAEIEALGVEALPVQCDVSTFEAVEGLVRQVQDRWGRIDALVHAAGPYHRGKILDETPEGWRDMFSNNLDSLFYAAKCVTPGMIERKWGRIVSFGMASAGNVVANTTVTAHFIAKMGVLALTRALAKQLAVHNVTANCISPGFIDSKSAPPEELTKMAKKIPAKRIGDVQDVVAAARYLLGDDAGYVTGANLAVSGGWGV